MNMAEPVRYITHQAYALMQHTRGDVTPSWFEARRLWDAPVIHTWTFGPDGLECIGADPLRVRGSV